MRSVAAVLAAMALLFAIPATASAASSSVDGYGGPGGATQTIVDPVAKVPTQSLPFTGSDLLPTVVVGLLLLGLGVGMRRGAARKS